ncbi:hypothetical protein ACTHAM_002396 [Cellulomonas soli]|uniref:hypothetical protein n=1 Tax=Cellulomonas soli TaxID=931535 RepID=UPI003F87E430
MTTLTPNTKKPPHRLQPVEGVIPTPEQENEMSPTVQISTDNVEQLDFTEAITALESAPVASTAHDDLGCWTKELDGSWRFDGADHTRDAQWVARTAVGHLSIEEPMRKVRLPEKYVEPNLARFNALAAAHRSMVLPIGSPDPRVDTPCPAWCEADGDHTVGVGFPDHTSEPIRVPLYANVTARIDHVIATSGFDVTLGERGNSRFSRTRTIGLKLTRKVRGEQAMRTEDLAEMSISEARALRDALDAAISLGEPDGDFEEAR